MKKAEMEEALKILVDMQEGLQLTYHGSVNISAEEHEKRYKRLYELTHGGKDVRVKTESRKESN